jgi:hypothetical protein
MTRPTRAWHTIAVQPGRGSTAHATSGIWPRASKVFAILSTFDSSKTARSTPAFLLRTPDRDYVLRKKPQGRLLPSARENSPDVLTRGSRSKNEGGKASRCSG